MISTDYVYVLGYKDHADGNSYFAEEHQVEMPYAFTTAISVLSRCDNVVIVDDEAYDNTEHHDFYSIAPYGINMGLGIYAKPAVKPQIVNNL